MNRRDQELLDRQMSRFQQPPRANGVIIVVLVAAFLAGMTAGSTFSFGSHLPGQSLPDDAKPALAFFLKGAEKVIP
jgi:hypothetical protein